MSLTANTRIFARKGEASPAGVTITQFPAEKPRTPVEIEDNRASSPARASASDSGPATSLSFLIQRNKAAVGTACFGDAQERAAAPAERAEAPKRRRSRNDAARDPQLDTSWSSGRASARDLGANAGGDAGTETWHKLSFRVRQDQYRKLKALSGLWGASFQGILERAVAAFVDSAIGDETEWDA